MPTPNQVKRARKKAGLTQAEAAEIALLSNRFRWAEYESDGPNHHEPDPARWNWFLLMTDQHPEFRLVKRRDT